MAGGELGPGVNPAELAHGQMFIGFFLNVLLCGIMITQVYLYGVTYKNDPRWIKFAVALIFIADLLHTGFIFGYLYESLIRDYLLPNAMALQKADWIFATDPALTGIIAMAVQLFFAWRVKVLTKTWVTGALVAALAIVGGIFGIWTAVEVVRTPVFIEFQKFKNVVVVWLAAEAICDILITGILVWYLRKHKTGFSHTDLIVDRIIRLTMQTGALTMIVAILDIVTYLTDPKGTHLIFNFTLAKLYTNSLMSTLNTRKGWNFSVKKQNGIDTELGPVTSSSGAKQGLSISAIRSGGGVEVGVTTTRPEIYVHVESHETRDPQGKNGLSSEKSFERLNEKSGWSDGPYAT